MNLAKWLAISGTVKQVGGQNRFVLPPVYRERAGFKYSNNSNSLTVLSENADVKKIEKEQPQAGQKNETASLNYSGEIKLATTKSDSTRALSAENDFSEPDFQKPTPVVNLPREKEDRLFASPATENKSANPAGESQLTLDDWKENSQRLERQTVSAQRSYYSVGRWALKRVMPGKIPKPPQIQREFRFKEIKVVRNDLNFSDVEIVVKPKQGFFSKAIYKICSLINLCSRSVRRLTHIVVVAATIII
ncbi:MAG: hypothetical protein ACP5MG_08175 [Verrucomicrobiia bacterium]